MSNEHPKSVHSPPTSTRRSSSSSEEYPIAIANHDWVDRQLRLRRSEYTAPINVKIKIVSWNVNGKRVGEDLTSLLLEDEEPGIYAIGYNLDLARLT